MKISREDLKSLMKNKLIKAGLKEEHAETTAEILTWSHERGYFSHGAVRVEYYSERIAKGGITVDPKFTFKQTGPCSMLMDGDNGVGYEVAKVGMEKAIEMAKENGVGVVCMARMSHSGSIGYYTEMAAKEGLLAFSCCQSDPMAVPVGGVEPYYGTNPLSFAAPTADDRTVVFDMATTVQAWGKILDKKSKGLPIPSDWAVDEKGNPVTDPNLVNALVPISGAKGYGLMMLVDVFSGILSGVPFGKHVSSMYHDCSVGRDLGQIHIVLDPERFCGMKYFTESMSATCDELNAMDTADGYDKVYWPGQRAMMRKDKMNAEGGLDLADSLYEYLISDEIHNNRYDHKNRFAE